MRPKSAINVEDMEVIHVNQIDPKRIPMRAIEALYRAISHELDDMERQIEEEMSKNAS